MTREPDQWRLPPIYDRLEFRSWPLAEQPGPQITEREAGGVTWQEYQEICGWGHGTGSVPVRVGVGDTGIDRTHYENGDLSGVIEAQDFTGSQSGWEDRHGHGSHCTGVIGARTQGQGMVGLAPKCELVHAKVLGDSGGGSTSGIARGIRWMADMRCHIISLSLGGGFSQAIENAIREVVEQGIHVFAAIGNSGEQGGGHPGTSRYTYGIAAVDWALKLAQFSSRDPMAKWSDYGVGVPSCVTGGRYAQMSGTSMACPNAAGVAALIFSWLLKHNKPLPATMEEYEHLVVSATQDLGPPGHDVGYGLGFVHLLKAIQNGDPGDPDDPPPPPDGKKMSGGFVMHDDGLSILTSGLGTPTRLVVGDRTYSGGGLTLPFGANGLTLPTLDPKIQRQL